MKTCPKCGAAGSDDMKYCPICGSMLEDAPLSSTQAVASIAQPAAQSVQNSAPQPVSTGNVATPPPVYTPPTQNGTTPPPTYTAPAQNDPLGGASAALSNLNNTADTTADYDAADISNNTVMAVLSYIGLLVLVPIFAAKESRYARFHSNQGLVLLVAEAVYGVARAIFLAIVKLVTGSGFIYGLLNFVLGLGGVAFLVLVILGIVNAASGKAKELPIIGKIRLLK